MMTFVKPYILHIGVGQIVILGCQSYNRPESDHAVSSPSQFVNYTRCSLDMPSHRSTALTSPACGTEQAFEY